MAIQTYSKLDILSKAVVLCGEPPLESLTDDRYGATVGAALFELVFENELQSNRWRFAMTKKALSQLVDAPLNEWQFAYQLPSDMLLPVGLFPARIPYEIYADHLYTNVGTVELDYLFKPTLDNCPAYFCLLLTYAMAKDMIKPMTESDAALQLLTKKYNIQQARAQYADAQGRPAKPIQSNPFTDVR